MPAFIWPSILMFVFNVGVPIKVTNKGDGTVKTDPLDIYLYLNTIG